MRLFKIFALFLLFIFLSCSVNTNTGLITVYNLSGKKVDQFKIGDTIVFLSLENGAKYDYWIFSSLGGKIYSEGADEILARIAVKDSYNNVSYTFFKDNPECIFKTDFEYHIDILNVDNKIRVYINPGEGAYSKYDYPAK